MCLDKKIGTYILAPCNHSYHIECLKLSDESVCAVCNDNIEDFLYDNNIGYEQEMSNGYITEHINDINETIDETDEDETDEDYVEEILDAVQYVEQQKLMAKEI